MLWYKMGSRPHSRNSNRDIHTGYYPTMVIIMLVMMCWWWWCWMIATIRQQLSGSTRLSGRAKCHGYIMWHMGDASPNRETTVDKPLMRKASSVDVLRAKQYHWVISPGKLYFPCQNWLIYLDINKKPWTFSWGFFSHGFQLRFSPLIIPMSQSNDLSEDKWFLLFAYYPVVFMQLPRKTRRSGPCCPPTSRWMLQKRSFASSRCNWNTEGPQEIEDFSGVSLFWMEMPGFPMGFWRI